MANSVYMDGPAQFSVAVDPTSNLAFVTGHNSKSVAVVSIADPASPSVLGGVINTGSMNGVRGIAVDPG